MQIFHRFRSALLALLLMVTLGASLLPGAVSANGLGDGEVCGDGIYLGRIETGGGYTVGQQITVGGFTIQVTSIKDGGEITGFMVVAGSYGYLVIHAGGGSSTFSDPTGPFAHGLSFVAFCDDVVPTATNTSEPTSTTTPEPTATETTEPTATATIGVTETVTDEPTATATLPVVGVTEIPTSTATPDDDVVVVKEDGLPNTGAGGAHGSTMPAVLTTILLFLAGLAWHGRRILLRR